MTEHEGAEPRYMPACQDTTKIIPWYDFLSVLVVVSAACRGKKSKMYPSTRSPGKETLPPPDATHLVRIVTQAISIVILL